MHTCVRGHMPDCMCTMMYSVLLYTACEGKEGNITLRVEGRRQGERERTPVIQFLVYMYEIH